MGPTRGDLVMRRSYSEQASFTTRAFREIVWPEIGAMCGGGNLVSLEGPSSDLDTRGGIDAYQVFRTGVRTIAQRTQRVDEYDKPSTFTIRVDRADGGITEWEKRVDALDRNNDLPTITVQAYVMEQKAYMVKAGIVHTRPFYQWARQNRHHFHRKEARDDGNGFLIIPWLLLMLDSNVPFAVKDLFAQVRSPKGHFIDWPKDRWI